MSEHTSGGAGVRTVDLTPTWSGILPGLLAVIENGETFEARTAALADSWVEVSKKAAAVGGGVGIVPKGGAL